MASLSALTDEPRTALRDQGFACAELPHREPATKRRRTGSAGPGGSAFEATPGGMQPVPGTFAAHVDARRRHNCRPRDNSQQAQSREDVDDGAQSLAEFLRLNLPTSGQAHASQQPDPTTSQPSGSSSVQRAPLHTREVGATVDAPESPAAVAQDPSTSTHGRHAPRRVSFSLPQPIHAIDPRSPTAQRAAPASSGSTTPAAVVSRPNPPITSRMLSPRVPSATATAAATAPTAAVHELSSMMQGRSLRLGRRGGATTRGAAAAAGTEPPHPPPTAPCMAHTEQVPGGQPPAASAVPSPGAPPAAGVPPDSMAEATAPGVGRVHEAPTPISDKELAARLQAEEDAALARLMSQQADQHQRAWRYNERYSGSIHQHGTQPAPPLALQRLRQDTPAAPGQGALSDPDEDDWGWGLSQHHAGGWGRPAPDSTRGGLQGQGPQAGSRHQLPADLDWEHLPLGMFGPPQPTRTGLDSAAGAEARAARAGTLSTALQATRVGTAAAAAAAATHQRPSSSYASAAFELGSIAGRGQGEGSYERKGPGFTMSLSDSHVRDPAAGSSGRDTAAAAGQRGEQDELQPYSSGIWRRPRSVRAGGPPAPWAAAPAGPRGGGGGSGAGDVHAAAPWTAELPLPTAAGAPSQGDAAELVPASAAAAASGGSQQQGARGRGALEVLRALQSSPPPFRLWHGPGGEEVLQPPAQLGPLAVDLRGPEEEEGSDFGVDMPPSMAWMLDDLRSAAGTASRPGREPAVATVGATQRTGATQRAGDGRGASVVDAVRPPLALLHTYSISDSEVEDMPDPAPAQQRRREEAVAAAAAAATAAVAARQRELSRARSAARDAAAIAQLLQQQQEQTARHRESMDGLADMRRMLQAAREGRDGRDSMRDHMMQLLQEHRARRLDTAAPAGPGSEGYQAGAGRMFMVDAPMPWGAMDLYGMEGPAPPGAEGDGLRGLRDRGRGAAASLRARYMPALYEAAYMRDMAVGAMRSGLPPSLLLSDRDFTADDYEMLLRLDDTVENRKGATQQEVAALPSLVVRPAAGTSVRVEEEGVGPCRAAVEAVMPATGRRTRRRKGPVVRAVSRCSLITSSSGSSSLASDGVGRPCSATSTSDDDSTAGTVKAAAAAGAVCSRAEACARAGAAGVLGPEAGSGRCMVCLEEWQEGAVLSQLHCKHLFHKDCVAQWLALKAVCPICQQDCRSRG